MDISTYRRRCKVLIVVAGMVGTSINTITVSAQGLALEEIVVTAQRREQSLQEVPVSIEVFSGAEVQLQGYRNLEDLSKFSPSVSIRDGSSQQTVTIRGFGTQGNSLTLQSATPIFLDGIHFGRPSMIKHALMDAERVEVLKGPQPIHFGMDATAGAFNIQSKRPTPEWEGELGTELGNDGKMEVEAAFGGPLTDTLGIRVVGLAEHGNGPVKNRVTGKKFPEFNNVAGRVLLEWTPTEQFNLVGKFDVSDQNNDGELWMGCLSGGTLGGFAADNILLGSAGVVAGTGNERAVWAPPPSGVDFATDAVLLEQKDPKDCFKGEYGISRDGPYLEPADNVWNGWGGNASTIRPGILDQRAAAQAFASAGDKPDTKGIAGLDETFTWNALLDGIYEFDNGITLNSQTGMVFFDRINVRENCDCLFSVNYFGRGERYDQFSQQFRFEGPVEGYELNIGIPGLKVRPMVGAFYQYSDTDIFTSGMRAHFRQGQRFNEGWEDATWMAGFWNLEFTFLEDQITFSAGGRQSDVKKDTSIYGYAAQWIVDERPCLATGTDANPATCTTDPNFIQVNPNLTAYTTGAMAGGAANNNMRIDSPRILVDPATVNMNDLWTARRWNQRLNLPLNWMRDDVNAVGLTPPQYELINGGIPTAVEQKANHYDHQFVLSLTPNAFGGDHTFYTKFVTAFKGPVTDTGLATLPAPADLEDFSYSPEYSKAYELGAKGMLFESRFRYDISVFRSEFRDLQTEVAAPLFNPQDQTRVSLNAGKQVVEGIEFTGTTRVTESLTFNFAGALMDGEMVEFDGAGCTGSETIAAAADAVNNPGGRTAAELTAANAILTTIGPMRSAHALAADIPAPMLFNGGCRLVGETKEDGSIAGAGTFNHSGDEATRTPDWKIIAGLDYSLPVMDNYQFIFDAKGFISSAYLDGQGASTLSGLTGWDKHGDINLSTGVGTQDGTWRLMLYARNLLEATQVYRPEYDFTLEGMQTKEVADSSFRQYGIRFDYLFQ